MSTINATNINSQNVTTDLLNVKSINGVPIAAIIGVPGYWGPCPGCDDSSGNIPDEPCDPCEPDPVPTHDECDCYFPPIPPDGISLIIASIKEQQTLITSQQTLITELTIRIAALEAK